MTRLERVDFSPTRRRETLRTENPRKAGKRHRTWRTLALILLLLVMALGVCRVFLPAVWARHPRNRLAGFTSLRICPEGRNLLIDGLNKEQIVPESNSILLVEDSPDDVLLTRLAYEQSGIGHRLVDVSNGEQAIQYLKGEGPYADRQQFPIPALILLDLDMPRMTGFEFLDWLRQEPELKHLPAIVLSGSLNPADEEHADHAGANCFLVKPTGVGELAEALTKICEFWPKVSKLPREGKPELPRPDEPGRMAA